MSQLDNKIGRYSLVASVSETSNNRSFWRKILLLALPVAAQTLLQALLGMADVAMVTGLGAEAVAAVGLAAKLHFLLLVLMIGVASAGSILIAQYSGAQDPDGSRQTLAITLCVGCLIAVPFTVIFCLGSSWLPWVNPDNGVVELAVTYLLITAPVLIMVQFVTIYEAALRAVGNTVVPLLIGAAGAVLNVVLNYIFIFGHLGFPAMGVAGAAWGTLLSRILQLLVYWLWLYGAHHTFALRLKGFVDALSWVAVKRFIHFALPLIVNHGVWGLGNATYHVATGFAGTEALAVMGVMVPIESAFFALFIGLASASAVMVGQSLGANKSELAWSLYKKFDRLALVLAISLSAILWLLRPLVLSGFAGLDAATTALLMDTMTIFCLVVCIKIMNMVRILGVLRAGGDNTFCLVTDTVVMWVFGLPIFVLAVYWGLPFLTLYTLMALEDGLKCIPVNRRIKLRLWMKNLTRSDKPAVLLTTQ